MRIAIIDKSPVFRLGLKAVIQRFLPETHFLEADCAFAIEESPPPQIVFLSLDELQSDRSKIMAVGRRFSQSAVIGAVSTMSENAFERDAQTGFIRDIIPKTASLERVTATCARAVINLPCKNETDGRASRPAGKRHSPIRLPPRHLETLRHLADGRSNQQIAERMSISVNTVRIYVSAILRSLNASNRTQAALIGRNLLKDTP